MASIFDSQLMSKSDLQKIEELEKAWRSTDDKNLRAQIHDRAESIRRGYGYSGGEDGSEYNALDDGVSVAASAANAYAGALEAAEQNRQRNYSAQQEAADELGRQRLREAYIKNMQNSLGLDQSMKAAGISGGLSESTRAAYDNSYMNRRDSIYADTLDAKQEIARDAAQSAYDSGAQIAKLQYDSAADRVDRLTQAQQRAYEREQDALEREYQERLFEYQKQLDASDLDLENRRFEYQKQKDALDREYEEKMDALNMQYKMASMQASAARQSNSQSQKQISNIISLMKSGYYSPEFAEILGLDPQKLQANIDKGGDIEDYAWDMIKHGIYDDSFPEILGYSEEILKSYIEAVKAGMTGD
ncbi:MAG: hypothetical protein J6K66_04310 [Clostridia bacterium]|nr:hypothetical protein [Clostridia bacterium]